MKSKLTQITQSIVQCKIKLKLTFLFLRLLDIKFDRMFILIKVHENTKSWKSSSNVYCLAVIPLI